MVKPKTIRYDYTAHYTKEWGQRLSDSEPA